MKGLFRLKTAKDLLGKLRHDLQRLTSDPVNEYAAFDFFVSARHMPEWLYPGDSKKQALLFQQHILLQVCRHIADGSKHFEATASYHTSVKDTSLEGAAFQPGFFQSTAFQVGQLIVTLDGQAAAHFGATIQVTALATKIFIFWETHPDLQ